MTYWQVQMQLLLLLEQLGLRYKATVRLPLFKIRLTISSNTTANPELVSSAVHLIDRLVEMRQQGLEPKHDGKRYL